MIRFGPSGNSQEFYDEGLKNTLQAPKWLHEKGLNAFEYSFGKGYVMSEDTAIKIGNEFKKYDICLSLHAPYFINFANPSEEMFEKTIGYIKNGIKFCKLMQADRLIFHPASCGKMKREEAFELTKTRLSQLCKQLDSENLLEGIYLCPETMGKSMQIGRVEEILELCELDEHLLPTFDFGHINCYMQGGLKNCEDFENIIKLCREKLGEKRGNEFHVHFSKIEFGEKGELRHLTFEDEKFGPNFEPFAKALKNQKVSPRILCESAGTQSQDALFMKKYYENL